VDSKKEVEMSLRKAVYDLLNNTETDCYPVYAPQELTDPYVVFFITLTPVRHQGGLTYDVDLTLNIFANDFSDVVSLADSLRAALENASGSLDSGNEDLEVCNFIRESDDYLPELDKKFIIQDYQLRFN
jgi:hypothetical protein